MNFISNSDFYIYNVDTDTVTEMSIDTYREGGPEPGFTQRACLDECSNELFILSGLMKEKASSTETAKNTFWAFDFLKTQDNWNLVYSNEKNDPVYWDKMACVEPCPRFAHQLVYDNISRVYIYLFSAVFINLNLGTLSFWWKSWRFRESSSSIK